jgi:DNA-binding protein HU-beta
MNKDQLIKRIAQKLNKHNTEVKKIVDSLFEELITEIGTGNKVNIVGFGSFESRKRASRVGRDPQTGDKIYLPETKTPAFSAGNALRSAVKSN